MIVEILVFLCVNLAALAYLYRGTLAPLHHRRLQVVQQNLVISHHVCGIRLPFAKRIRNVSGFRSQSTQIGGNYAYGTILCQRTNKKPHKIHHNLPSEQDLHHVVNRLNSALGSNQPVTVALNNPGHTVMRLFIAAIVTAIALGTAISLPPLDETQQQLAHVLTTTVACFATFAMLSIATRWTRLTLKRQPNGKVHATIQDVIFGFIPLRRWQIDGVTGAQTLVLPRPSNPTSLLILNDGSGHPYPLADAAYAIESSQHTAATIRQFIAEPHGRRVLHIYRPSLLRFLLSAVIAVASLSAVLLAIYQPTTLLQFLTGNIVVSVLKAVLLIALIFATQLLVRIYLIEPQTHQLLTLDARNPTATFTLQTWLYRKPLGTPVHIDNITALTSNTGEHSLAITRQNGHTQEQDIPAENNEEFRRIANLLRRTLDNRSNLTLRLNLPNDNILPAVAALVISSALLAALSQFHFAAIKYSLGTYLAVPLILMTVAFIIYNCTTRRIIILKRHTAQRADAHILTTALFNTTLDHWQLSDISKASTHTTINSTSDIQDSETITTHLYLHQHNGNITRVQSNHEGTPGSPNHTEQLAARLNAWLQQADNAKPFIINNPQSRLIPCIALLTTYLLLCTLILWLLI
ncbi:hypothetical protein KRX19_02730 [Cardiobacteriaceae bacterium TAE3-ERU3]|nr:hypothetical protein [Cardiobacteriaceae bacterium TAE3-ERU3]